MSVVLEARVFVYLVLQVSRGYDFACVLLPEALLLHVSIVFKLVHVGVKLVIAVQLLPLGQVEVRHHFLAQRAILMCRYQLAFHDAIRILDFIDLVLDTRVDWHCDL